MSIKYESVSCNLCGSENYEQFLERGDLSTGIPGMFNLVKCKDCGLVYQCPRPSLESWDAIYPEEYDQYAFDNNQSQNGATILKNYGVHKRVRLLSKFSKGGKVCDIGCSTGDFLFELRNSSQWECYGVEPKKAAAEAAKKRGLNVVHGMFDEDIFPGVQFDVITLWNVIEHLYNPVETLNIIHNRLKLGGTLIFNTPNLDSLDAKIFKQYWIGFELPRHMYVFSEETISRLMQTTDFKIINNLCFYGQHAAAMSSVRFLLRSKLNNRYKFIEDFLFSYPLKGLLAPIFYVQDKMKKSSQVTIVAKKINLL